jgi:Ca2+-binding EF-hand superfamily protein
VERFDQDRDGKIGFWEFSNSLLPMDSILRDDLERRKASFDLGYETRELLRRMFRKLIDAESMIENIRQRIKKEPIVSLRKAFDALDWLGRGFLTSNEFKKAFDWQYSEVGSTISTFSPGSSIRKESIELEGLIRRFNRDKLNGRVTLSEFIEELTPKSHQKIY